MVILGAGRRAATAGLGLDAAGVKLTGRGGIAIDERCQAGRGLWALGDVTGIALFTHVAMYQGRVVADNILGRDRTASYQGIPRVIFADPEIAAVGLTATQAVSRGINLAAAEIGLADAVARPWTYERDPRGDLGLLADRDRGVLVGAWAVAPLASEWIHQAALAIRARIPIDMLLDQDLPSSPPTARHTSRRWSSSAGSTARMSPGADGDHGRLGSGSREAAQHVGQELGSKCHSSLKDRIPKRPGCTYRDGNGCPANWSRDRPVECEHEKEQEP